MKPLSRTQLIKNGQCCGSKCTNCPYTPKYKKGSKKIKQEKTSFPALDVIFKQ